MSDASAEILYEVQEHVGIITLNRPHRHNAMTDDTSALMEEVLAAARADRAARVLLIRGAGPSFCSGRDTAQLGERSTGLSHFEHLSRSLHRKLDFTTIQKPIVAAVHGHAVGGGFELALACDIRVVAEDAKLSLPEIDYGIMTDRGGSVLSTILAGPGRAMYLIMSGESISGRLAHEWGLADFVVPAGEVHDRGFEIARTIAAKPPMNVALAKQLVWNAWGAAVTSGLRNEAVALTAIYASEDYLESRAARREQRPPEFTGR